MPERLHPGVYVEEVPPTVRAIEGVSTSTAAFIGVAERGPVGKPVLVTSFKEYQDKSGGFKENSFLTYSVLNFFENGGRKCYIVRVVGQGAEKASIELRDRERVEIDRAVAGTEETMGLLFDMFPEAFAEPVLTISASSPGKWGNDIDIEIKESTNNPNNELKIIVKRGDEVLETWDNLSMVMGDDNYVENVIGGGQSQYILVKRIKTAKSDTPGVLISGVLDNAAKNLKYPPINGPNFNISLNGSASVQILLDSNDSAEDIAEDIQKKVRNSAPQKATEEQKRAFENFECHVKTKGSEMRYILISGEGGLQSKVEVIPGTENGTHTDVRGRLKLNTSATVDSALAISGLDLQRGTSRSAEYPETHITDNKRTLSFNLNKDGKQQITLDAELATGDAIAEDIKAKVRGISTQRKDPKNEEAYQKFEAKYNSQYELIFGDVTANAGTFEFTSSGSGTDLASGTYLRLNVPGTTYGGSTNGPLKVEPDLSARQRTIISEGNSAVTDISKINDGYLGLKIIPYMQTGSPQEITIKISIPTEMLTNGVKIAEAIKKAVLYKETQIDDPDADPELKKLKGYPATREALKGFEARYVAYYILKSGAVCTDGGKIGPISSVEVLPSDIEAEDIAIDLKLGRHNGGIEPNGAAMLRPENGEYHLGDHTVGGAVNNVTKGTDGNQPTDDDFTGPNGLKLLDKVDDVNIIAIPGRGSKRVISAGLGYCMNRKLQDCFFIADMGGPHEDDPSPDQSNPFINTRDEAKQFVPGISVKSDYGAIYFPWVIAPDPIGKGKNPKRYLPPSGYMAGIYARIDSKRGVFKAPAGTEANLIGTALPALEPAIKVDDTDQDFLNPIGVNVIRSFPASGIVAWGTRTMGSDPAWRYISVRRLAIFLRISIYNGIQWAVFEPNDEPLWSSLRLNIGAFMYNQFRAGAFQGSTPAEAYFVRCDSTTTTQQDIDNGIVNVLVGFAPLKPAEFVVIKISQKAGQTPK